MNNNTVIRLKEEYRDEILANPELQGKVASASMKSVATINRWCKDNAQQLTMLSVLNAIREYKKLSKDVSLTAHVEKEKVAA